MNNTGTSRRDFLRASAVAGGALGLGLVPGACGDSPPVQTGPSEKLKILVLGGTGFIGPHTVRYALERGHELTLFNRGRSNTELFPDVEKLVGDRNGDLESLRGRSWDVCFDNNASNIDWVEYSTELLKDSVGRYHYVSSRSAYSDLSSIPMHANAPTFTYETAGVEPGAERLPYGLQKALCERRVQEVFPETSTIFRPGLIIGPGDTTDRFTYWPVRIHRGGEVLAPSDGSDPVQIIDVRESGLPPPVPWPSSSTAFGPLPPPRPPLPGSPCPSLRSMISDPTPRCRCGCHRRLEGRATPGSI